MTLKLRNSKLVDKLRMRILLYFFVSQVRLTQCEKLIVSYWMEVVSIINVSRNVDVSELQPDIGQFTE